MKRSLQPPGCTSTDSARPGKRTRTEFGLKELAPGINPDLDIVAIHGIDGDREDSWTADNGVLWLRDLLPSEIPNARILTYGYDANTHGQEQLATDFMHEHAMTFISKLTLFRRKTETVERSIIFLAHSSGGLLLKSALIHSHMCHDNHLKNHRAISLSTHAVAFFGTPHLGSATAEFARSILEIESFSKPTPTSNVLLKHLERDSEALQHQLAQYSAISGQFETKFFYETYPTKIAGVSKRVVPRSSAVVPGAINAEAIGINKDHVHMIMFPSADDEDFKTVSATLSFMSKAACQKMEGKGDRHQGTTMEFPLTPSQQSALSNLQQVNAAQFDTVDRPLCLEGTRVELLRTISEWAEQDTSNPQVFRLCGQAGTGKTTISSTVARSCNEQGHLGASFFFSRDHSERNDLQLVFPSVAHQLGIFHKPFQKSLAEILERNPTLVQKTPMDQFNKLIIEPLKLCESFPTSTIIVIDGLDECQDENSVSRMLSILSSHIHQLPCLKFFITSRPVAHILTGFRPLSTNTQSVILHEIEASVIDADIERYLRDGFSNTAQLYPYLVEPGWPSDESIKSLVRMSGRLFIFAATAMNFILDHAYSHPPKQLAILLTQSPQTYSFTSSPFAFLDRLYLQVLRHAFPEQTTSDRFALLRMVLGAIVLLRDPLSAAALARLLDIECGIVRTTLRHLHSVMVVPTTDEHPIQLIHPSFFDFATSRCPDGNFRIDPLVYHEQLTIGCFKQMSRLKRNMCSIQDASKLNSEIEDLAERVERCIPPAVQYACRHWPFHLRLAAGNTLQGMLAEFFCQRILYWIEVLSLLCCLQEGIHHLQDVLNFLNTFLAPSEDLLKALDDTIRFMTDLFEPISCASLQLYRSALPLSAPSSFLHKTFHHELAGGMRVLQGEWLEQSSSGVTTLRGSASEVHSVDFSPDGTILVSTAYCDAVRLWRCDTGTFLRKLDCSPDPDAVAKWARFFPDGSRVIAASTDAIIWIWNVDSGTCIRSTQLEGHSDYMIFCYTISPDFKRIVGGANNPEDDKIFIWDISTDNPPEIVEFPDPDEIRAISFSLDGKLIAWASDNSTIYIWDAINRREDQILRVPTADIMFAIAFSPDSKYLVSGSRYTDICIWDLSNGVALKTLKGPGMVRSVAFSPDGARIISGASDGSLEVWDAIGGELLETISIPGAIHAQTVGFSPDGTQYVWATDETIHIRHAEFDHRGVSIDTQDLPYFCSANQITLSPNLEFIAFCAYENYLSLWSIPHGKILWNSRTGFPIDSAFSSDSTRIISISKNCLRLLDVASGDNIYTFFLDYTPDSAHFSPDGSQIITEDGGIYVIPRDFRQLSPPLTDASSGISYFIDEEWIFASDLLENEERCVWLPPKWREVVRLSASFGTCSYSSSRGHVAIVTVLADQLVLLDLSGIQLSLLQPSVHPRSQIPSAPL